MENMSEIGIWGRCIWRWCVPESTGRAIAAAAATKAGGETKIIKRDMRVGHGVEKCRLGSSTLSRALFGVPANTAPQ